MEEDKNFRSIMAKKRKDIIEDAEVESYRIQVRLSPRDYERLKKEAIETCTAMSMLGSMAIHDWLDDREKKRKTT